MRAFQYIFNEGLGGGLRRFSSNPCNKQSLTECHNAMPNEDGLVPHETVISLDADDISWGGEGKLTAYSPTRSITINITDYVSAADVATASVYLDGTLQGTTDANGEINLTDVTIGTHTLKITKTGYVDSDDDTLLNDYLVVT